MKAILEFNLPEDREQYNIAFHAGDLYSTLYDFDQWLRHLEKYEGVNTLNIDEIRSKIREIMREYNVNLDMMS